MLSKKRQDPSMGGAYHTHWNSAVLGFYYYFQSLPPVDQHVSQPNFWKQSCCGFKLCTFSFFLLYTTDFITCSDVLVQGPCELRYFKQIFFRFLLPNLFSPVLSLCISCSLSFHTNTSQGGTLAQRQCQPINCFLVESSMEGVMYCSWDTATAE